MVPECAGFRFYRLRRNPWRRIDRIDTVAGILYKPADYTGDYLMVCPADISANGRRYYPVYGALIPGNRASLGYGEVARLTSLTHAGYRRVPFDQLPVAWQEAFFAEIAAITRAAVS